MFLQLAKGFVGDWGPRYHSQQCSSTSRATVFLQRLLAKRWGVLEGEQDEMNVMKFSFFDLLLTLLTLS